jgi:hypothetical protein
VIAAVLATSSALALVTITVIIRPPGEEERKVQLEVDLPILEPLQGALSQVQYEIHTAGGTGCNIARVTRGVYGVPTPVDVAGNLLPDIAVQVVPIPAPGGVTMLSMTVTKITTGSLPARVQAVLAPGGSSDPNRVAFGYDGCDSASPQRFDTRIVTQPTQLSLETKPSGAGAHLTILGAAYKQNGATITDPTQVAARFEPVPSDLGAVIDILANSTYKAHVDTDVASKLGFAYLNESGAKRTEVNAGLVKLPETVDLTLNGSSVNYTTSAPIGAAAIDVTSTQDDERTTQVSADLLDLPTTASFVRDGESHATFTTPGEVGEANVRFASFEPGTTLPTVPTNTNQFFSAEIRDDFQVADLRLTGVKTLSGGWGDDFDLDLVHDAGPFDIGVVTDTQTVDGSIVDLPADIELGYTKALGAFTYDGSDGIGTITLDLLSSEPFGTTRADEVHVVVTDIPEHITATLDHTGKTFAAQMPGGKLGEIEILVTNGPADKIANEVDGLVFTDPALKPAEGDPPVDPSTPYQAFVRVSELESVTVGWGDTQSVHVVHDEQPFKLDVELAKSALDENDLTYVQRVDVVGTLASLPHDVGFTYTPSELFTYDSDTQMQTLDITVQKSRPTQLISKLGVHAELLPTDLDIAFDEPNRGVTATIDGPPLHLLEVSIRNTDAAEHLLGPDAVGVSKIERILFDGDEENNAFVRLKDIRGASVAMGPEEADAPVTVSLHHAGGPFVIKAEQDGFGPKIPLFKNKRTVDVNIPNLPADINSLSYSGKTRELHFNAATGIEELDANVTNTVEPVAGDIEGPYAKQLKLHAEGIPAVLDFLPTFTSDEADPRDANTAIDLGPGQTIGLVELLLTSGPDNRALLGDEDGLVFEDLETSYTIFARATGLSHIHYGTAVHDGTVSEESELGVLDVDTRMLGDEQGPRNLNVILRTWTGDVKKRNGTEYLEATYLDPPARNHLLMLALKHDDGTDWTTRFEYEGFAADGSPDNGGHLQVTTNKGAQRSFLTADVEPIPATAKLCIAPGDGECDDQDPPGSREEQSYKIFDLSEPINIDLADCKESKFVPQGPSLPPIDIFTEDDIANCDPAQAEGDAYRGSLVDASAYIQHEVTALTQADFDCDPDCVYVHIDTADGDLIGHLRKFKIKEDDRSTELKIDLPERFRTRDRFVKIECDLGCTGHTSGEDWGTGKLGGKAACPADTLFGVSIIGIDLNFAEEFCPGAKPTGLETSEVARGTTIETKLLGRDFSPDAGISVGTLSSNGIFQTVGVSVSVISPDPGDYYDTLLVSITAPQGVATGTYDLRVVNPDDAGTGFCLDCITIT